MSRVPALVIAGPGTNRDRDVQHALELAGAEAQSWGPKGTGLHTPTARLSPALNPL